MCSLWLQNMATPKKLSFWLWKMEVISRFVHLFFFRGALQPVPVPGGLRGASRQSSGWKFFLKERLHLFSINISVIITSLTKIVPSKTQIFNTGLSVWTTFWTHCCRRFCSWLLSCCCWLISWFWCRVWAVWCGKMWPTEWWWWHRKDTARSRGSGNDRGLTRNWTCCITSRTLFWTLVDVKKKTT